MISLEYYTGKDCGVCIVLKPKLFGAVEEQFKDISIQTIQIEKEPEYAAKNMVFTLPVVIVKLDGKEQFRFAKSFGVSQVTDKLTRLQDAMVS